jgi:hypothetical protein
MTEREKIEELALVRATRVQPVKSGCVGGWLDVVGGHKVWYREEWE